MLGQQSGQTSASIVWHARVRRALCVGLGLLSGLASTRVQAATPQDQQVALAATGAVKLVVRGQGWLQRPGQPALVAAGLPANVDPAKLQLFADGVEQALLVTGDGDTTFAAGEAIEFYGTGRDTLWTDARTYWLVAGTSAGARVPLQTPAAGGAPPTSYFQSQPLVERKNYVSAILNGDVTNFFGDPVAATPVMKTLSTQHLDASAAGAAELRVSLQGATATPHLVDVTFNGQSLGTASLGQTASATFSFSVANVVEGANQVTLVSHGTADASAVESLELSYPHLYAADGDALAFTAPAGTRVSVTAGFSAAGVRVVDVTDPTRPIELVVTPATVGTSTTARVDTPAGAGDRSLIAFLAANVGAPANVVADAPSSWAASHDGELVIISHASFLGSLAPLVARRRQEGWSVQLVDVQDVYDERNGGDKSVSAIRDFLQAARARWPAACAAALRPARGRRQLRSAQLPRPGRLRLRAVEAHRHGDDGDGVGRLVRRRRSGRRARDRRGPHSRAHGRAGRRRGGEDARLARRRRSPARRALRDRHQRRRHRLRDAERRLREQGRGHHASRPVQAQRRGEHVGCAPHEARRGAVPRQLPRARLGRDLGLPADERAGRDPRNCPGFDLRRHGTASTVSFTISTRRASPRRCSRRPRAAPSPCGRRPRSRSSHPSPPTIRSF